jgi:hypothetical protein
LALHESQPFGWGGERKRLTLELTSGGLQGCFTFHLILSRITNFHFLAFLIELPIKQNRQINEPFHISKVHPLFIIRAST